MVEEERVQRTMEFLKWVGGAAGSLAQNVSVGAPTVSVGLPTCILHTDVHMYVHTYPVSNTYRFC